MAEDMGVEALATAMAAAPLDTGDQDMEEGTGGQDMAAGTIVVDIGGTNKGLTVIMNESRQLGAR